MYNLRGLLKMLSDSNHRITNTLREMLGILYEAQYPLSVPQIIKRLEKRGIKANKTTIYRQIASLVGEGSIKEIRIKSNITHYELSGLEHHHHLICESCGKVDKVTSHQLEKSMRRLEEKVAERGFTVKEHNLEFFGVCSSCQ